MARASVHHAQRQVKHGINCLIVVCTRKITVQLVIRIALSSEFAVIWVDTGNSGRVQVSRSHGLSRGLSYPPDSR